jgi:hypothetical protein
MQKLLKSNYFLLLAFPAITSSLITVKPSIAATFASSEAGFHAYNFSISPKDIKTFTNTNTQAVNFSSQGRAKADAVARANFTSVPNLPLSFANNISRTKATGEGKDYFGIAESFASVTGYNFQVPSDGVFSFDFTGFLNLKAFVDNPSTEYADANGLISLQLYDQDGTLLDSLSIQANTTTSDTSNFLTNNKTENFAFIPNKTYFNTDFIGINKYANASVNGYYSRKFTAGTNLSLFEMKANRAHVVVPEPTSQLAVVFGVASILLIVKTKRKLIASNCTK